MRRRIFYTVVISLFLLQAGGIGLVLWELARIGRGELAPAPAGLILLPQLVLILLLLRHFRRRDYRSRDMNELNAWKGKLLGNLPSAVFAKDVEDGFRYVFANERFRDLLKIRQGGVLGKDNYMVWGATSNMAKEMQAEDEELVSRGGMIERTRELTDSEGVRHYVRYTKALLTVNGRRLLVGVCSDVTTAEEAKLQTEEMQGILQELLDHMPASVMVKDATNDFRYVIWNQELERQTGVLAADVIGKNDYEIDAFPGMSEVFRARDLEVLSSGETMPFIEYCSTATGKRLVLNTFKGILQMESGRTFIFDLCLDETRKHELEDEREAIIELLNNMVKNERIINLCLQRITVESDFDVAVKGMLELIGRDAGADVCSVFVFTADDGTRAEALYEWAADGHPTAGNSFRKMDLTPMPDFRRQLEGRRDLVLPNIANPPPAHADVARFYQEFGIKSALVTGVWLDGKLWGFLCMHYLKSAHLFTKSDIHTIHDAVNLFMLAHERNRQMNAIADSSYLHRQIFDTLNMSVAMIDFDYNITMANASCLREIGKTQAELRGEKCFRLLCKCSAAPAWCPLRLAARDRQAHQVECVRDGRHLLVMSQPIFDRSGRVMSVLEISIDTTELYQQKQQLEVNNLLLNRAAEVAQMTYFKGDRSGRVTWLGGNEDMGISRQSSTLLREWVVAGDAASIVRACLELTEGRGTVVELICRTEVTGPRRSMRLRMSSREQADGAFFGIMQDITAQVESETLKNDLIQRLNNYIENERVLNNCLAQSVLEDDFDKNIDAILHIIAAQLHCERVFCGMFAEGMSSFALQYEWKTSGLVGWRGWGLPDLEAHFRQWREEGGREIIKIVAVDAGGERRSLLGAPIRLGGGILGVLQFEYAGGRDFTDVDESVIRSAARIISLTKEREVQRERLDASIRERQIIYNHIKIPILLFDRQGALLNMNPAAADLCASLHDNTGGAPFRDLFKRLLPSAASDRLEAVIRANRTLSLDVQFGPRHYIMNVEPILARGGEVNNIIASLVDVTAIIESKRHLEVAVKAAQAADRAKSYFLATMSHELRTPLNSVIGFSELLRQGPLTAAERDEYLVSINLAGKALLNLISDILDLSKIEAGQLTIKPIRTKIAGLIGDVHVIFKHKAKEKGLAFTVRCPDNLPDVDLDNLRLRQVMLNLVGNAIKFTPTGSVELEVSFAGGGVATGTEGDDGELTISVRDTGIGIDAAHVQIIFDPFVQEDDARGNRAYDGSGLGLAITKRLVDKMGGALEVDSQVGVGSCFRLILRNLHYAPPPMAVQADGKALAAEPTAGRHRILAVDDVEMNLKVMESMLKKLGVPAVCAKSGPEALEKLQGQVFDIIFTDMWMSGMNGEELVRNIRRLPGGQTTRIYAVTADIEAVDNFDLRLFDGILHKPLVMDTLRKLL